MDGLEFFPDQVAIPFLSTILDFFTVFFLVTFSTVLILVFLSLTGNYDLHPTLSLEQ